MTLSEQLGTAPTPIKKGRLPSSLHIVRYADDLPPYSTFQLPNASPNSLMDSPTRCGFGRRGQPPWNNRGSPKLSDTKTSIGHTLDLSGLSELTSQEKALYKFETKPGFDFLGFSFLQKRCSKHKSDSDPGGNLLGYITLVYPSSK